MANRTQVRTRHHAELEQFTFDVSKPIPHFSKTEFIIDLRRSILHPTKYWWKYKPMATVGSLPTLLGREVLNRLNKIDSIQLALDTDRPTCVFIFVEMQAAADGLPDEVSLAIEETLLSYPPSFAAIAKWLRCFV